MQIQGNSIMHPNGNVVMDAILIGVAFLTIGVSVERNFLFVNSATVALQTSADSTSTTASDYAQPLTTTTTTDRYPRLYAENDNYGKQRMKRTLHVLTRCFSVIFINSAITRSQLIGKL